MSKSQSDKYEWLTPRDSKTLVDISERVFDVLGDVSDEDDLMLSWIALMLNVKKLGEVMLKKATVEDFKTQLIAYLEKTEEWIITQDKINKIM